MDADGIDEKLMKEMTVHIALKIANMTEEEFKTYLKKDKTDTEKMYREDIIDMGKDLGPLLCLETYATMLHDAKNGRIEVTPADFPSKEFYDIYVERETIRLKERIGVILKEMYRDISSATENDILLPFLMRELVKKDEAIGSLAKYLAEDPETTKYLSSILSGVAKIDIAMDKLSQLATGIEYIVDPESVIKRYIQDFRDASPDTDDTWIAYHNASGKHTGAKESFSDAFKKACPDDEDTWKAYV